MFGVSNDVLPDSYVDRGSLDARVRLLLGRPTHIALRGASKCGKSWLRQTAIPDAIVVQCRLGKTTVDLYREALSELGLRVELQRVEGSSIRGRVEASLEAGLKLLAKVGLTSSIESTAEASVTSAPVGRDIEDLRFIAEILKASDRRLVIEDFHYLSAAERRAFAFDLKALWDFGVFAVVVGIWSEQNLVLHLNPDLTGRFQEETIVWGASDLRKIFELGGQALNLRFSPEVQDRAIADCYGNAGILQTLILGMLDELCTHEAQQELTEIRSLDALETAELRYAEQLDALYQQFARRVSGGIRTRQDSTGIYSHAMAVILDADDEALLRGLSIDQIYNLSHAHEPRIQKGNLHTVLVKFPELQVDDEGRGLVLAYNEADREISVVDRQLLLYRKYTTMKWPWEDLIREALANDGSDSASEE